MNRVSFSASDVQFIRDTVGIGLLDIKRAIELAKTDEFNGDIVLAVGYLHVSGLAIHVSGDRHAWNMNRGAGHAQWLRDRLLGLAERFPAVTPAPVP